MTQFASISANVVSHSAQKSIGWQEWQEFNDKISGEVTCSFTQSDENTFSADASLIVFDNVVLADIHASGHQFKRDSIRVNRDDIDHFYLQHYRRAGGSHIQSFRPIENISTGEMIFLDFSVPFETHHTDFEVTTLVLKRELFSDHIDIGSSYPSFRVSRTRPEYRVISTLIEELRLNALVFDQKSVSGLFGCIVDLVGNILKSTRSKDPEFSQHNKQYLQFRQAQQVMMSQLANTAANSSSLVDAMGLSRATVYRLFEEHGGIMQSLKQLRLSKAKQLISANPQVKIQQVAMNCGFKSSNHFSRAFKEEYSVSPRLFQNSQKLDSIRPMSQYVSWALAGSTAKFSED
ncbi:helix-turn-helix domain-containing protein [Pseudovibrio sp. Tun.PSC04-5.I4]|uniref:helix-turn-helix domain-containing protein n=1 Tax=Pseudovibrio sp. Tun.PSC04-5.I4 TaxID=1798213 RepID=UPI000890CAE8|nr:helix-turn-helix domain-containing protein [Pseudovibrio sp. Tun.PSC04-5.I4]SDQ20341.1 Helix-turn-helix domain-containing protein [Pseudovibrio sp. Tun.PSC04-5.I4]